MAILEVRCCCEPQKLRGWLDVDLSIKKHIFYLLPVTGAFKGEILSASAPIDTEQVVLEISALEDNCGGRYWALKAEGVPLEKLHRVPGFVPA